MSYAAPRCTLLQPKLIRSLGRVSVKTGSRGDPEARLAETGRHMSFLPLVRDGPFVTSSKTGAQALSFAAQRYTRLGESHAPWRRNGALETRDRHAQEAEPDLDPGPGMPGTVHGDSGRLRGQRGA